MKKPKPKVFYMCGVDYQHEIGHAPDLEGRQPLYSSLKEFKAKRSCWKQCGIVKVELTLSKWVKRQCI